MLVPNLKQPRATGSPPQLTEPGERGIFDLRSSIFVLSGAGNSQLRTQNSELLPVHHQMVELAFETGLELARQVALHLAQPMPP